MIGNFHNRTEPYIIHHLEYDAKCEKTTNLWFKSDFHKEDFLLHKPRLDQDRCSQIILGDDDRSFQPFLELCKNFIIKREM